MKQLTRSDFLLRAAGTGGAAVAGAAVGWLAAPALGAASEQDLAWVRFGVAAEFVSAEYYRQVHGLATAADELARYLP